MSMRYQTMLQAYAHLKCAIVETHLARVTIRSLPADNGSTTVEQARLTAIETALIELATKIERGEL